MSLPNKHSFISGNFLHYFAEAGNTEVLGNLMAEALMPNYKRSQESSLISKEFKVTPNKFGDTFLHVYALKHNLNNLFRQIDQRETKMADELYGSTEAHDEQKEARNYAKKTLTDSLEIQNKNGYTFLAVSLNNVQDDDGEKREIEALKQMTIVFGEKVISKVCQKKDSGDNCLAHLAVRKSLTKFMEFILPKITKPYNILNQYGYNPLHLSVQTNNRKMARSIARQKNFDVNKQMENGETALHLAAQLGQSGMLGELIDHGGDLSVRDTEDGHTPLHDCLQQLFFGSGGTEEKLGTFVNIWNTVVEKAVRWWCLKHKVSEPTHGSNEYLELQRKAVYYLRSSIQNKDGLSVLQYAADRGLVRCVQVMLSTKDIFVVQSPGQIYEIDMTNLCPEYADNLNKQGNKQSEKFVSFVHVLAEVKPPNKAGEILESIPMRKLTEMEWYITHQIHLFWAVMHSILMVLATADITTSNNASTVWSLQSTLTAISILFYATVMTTSHFLIKVMRHASQLRNAPEQCDKIQERRTIFDSIMDSFRDVYYETPFIIELLFTSFAWVMYIQKMVNIDRNDYVWIDGLFLLFGWIMLLIPMTAYFRIYKLISVLQYITLNDMLPWLLIYFSISIGYAAAIKLQFDQLPRNSTTCDDLTLFLDHTVDTFLELEIMMLGLDTDLKHVRNVACLFEDNTKNMAMILFLITTYAVISVLVLLNMLIAIMTNTVTEAQQDKGWRQYQVSYVHSFQYSYYKIIRFGKDGH